MKEEQELLFENLLKKRQKLSEKNKQNKKIISSEDTQLIDMLENFNESDAYKEIQPDD